MRSVTLPTFTRVKINRSVAVGVWLVGVMFTSWFWQSLGLPVAVAGIVALFCQAALTKLQSPLHTGHYNPVTLGALFVDAILLNAAGLWQGMKNFGNTNTWNMLAEWTGNISEAGVAGEPHILALILLTVLLAILAAITPELIWNQPD